MLYRGLHYVKDLQENLNGYWVGAGFTADGNYYADQTVKDQAINYYGFDQEHGWAMAYKLSPSARVTEPNYIDRISLDEFIQKTQDIHNAETDDLVTIHSQGNDNGLRAVLLRFDAIADFEAHHYIVHNNAKLVHCEDLTPWALGLPKSIEDPDTGKTIKKIDITAELDLQYQSAKAEALRLLTGGQP